MSKLFVIAGNQDQFRVYRNKVMDEKLAGGIPYHHNDIVYVHNTDILRGIRDPKGVFYGTWRERSDIKQIFDQLMICMEPDTEGRKVVSDLYVKFLKEQFEATLPPKPTPVQVSLNGVVLSPADYIVYGTTVILSNPSHEILNYQIRSVNGLMSAGLILPYSIATIDAKIKIS